MEFVIIVLLVIISLTILYFLNSSNDNTENFRLNEMRPNKCYDCEAGLTDKNINIGFPGKCIDCENKSKNPFFEGPNKSFDSEIRFHNNDNKQIDNFTANNIIDNIVANDDNIIDNIVANNDNIIDNFASFSSNNDNIIDNFSSFSSNNDNIIDNFASFSSNNDNIIDNFTHFDAEFVKSENTSQNNHTCTVYAPLINNDNCVMCKRNKLINRA